MGYAAVLQVPFAGRQMSDSEKTKRRLLRACENASLGQVVGGMLRAARAVWHRIDLNIEPANGWMYSSWVIGRFAKSQQVIWRN